MTVVAAAVVLTMPAATASAEALGDTATLTCYTTSTPDPEAYEPGWGEVKNATAPLRPGPYADCGTRETLYQGYTMTIYCHYNNRLGSTWFYVSAYPNWTRGWIFANNVTYHGLIQQCF
ncbi:hypothetical protein [Streptomyces sp. NPDC053367]|uniref:hypothetical protein n=1 Tax=Streptomyces sp. NPDC053367 TaxID=3365700 RepID=UPI0037D0B23A